MKCLIKIYQYVKKLVDSPRNLIPIIPIIPQWLKRIFRNFNLKVKGEGLSLLLHLICLIMVYHHVHVNFQVAAPNSSLCLKKDKLKLNTLTLSDGCQNGL